MPMKHCVTPFLPKQGGGQELKRERQRDRDRETETETEGERELFDSKEFIIHLSISIHVSNNDEHFVKKSIL